MIYKTIFNYVIYIKCSFVYNDLKFFFLKIHTHTLPSKNFHFVYVKNHMHFFDLLAFSVNFCLFNPSIILTKMHQSKQKISVIKLTHTLLEYKIRLSSKCIKIYSIYQCSELSLWICVHWICYFKYLNWYSFPYNIAHFFGVLKGLLPLRFAISVISILKGFIQIP